MLAVLSSAQKAAIQDLYDTVVGQLRARYGPNTQVTAVRLQATSDTVTAMTVEVVIELTDADAEVQRVVKPVEIW